MLQQIKAVLAKQKNTGKPLRKVKPYQHYKANLHIKLRNDHIKKLFTRMTFKKCTYHVYGILKNIFDILQYFFL